MPIVICPTRLTLQDDQLSIKNVWKRLLNWIHVKASESWHKTITNLAYSAVQDLKQIEKKNYKEGTLIPHKLSLENKTLHSTICSSILTRSANLSFLHCIITSDKKCFLHVSRKQKFGWHKMRNQCQLQTQKPGEIWKVSFITSYWNIEGPSLQTFITISLIGQMNHYIRSVLDW